MHSIGSVNDTEIDHHLSTIEKNVKLIRKEGLKKDEPDGYKLIKKLGIDSSRNMILFPDFTQQAQASQCCRKKSCRLYFLCSR